MVRIKGGLGGERAGRANMRLVGRRVVSILLSFEKPLANTRAGVQRGGNPRELAVDCLA